MKKENTAASPVAPAPHARNEIVDRPTKNQKPYPCLLTRAGLKAIIAEQLG